MASYFLDVGIVAGLIIVLTAIVGVLVNGIGNLLFGGSKRSIHVDQSNKIQENWRQVGGDTN